MPKKNLFMANQTIRAIIASLRVAGWREINQRIKDLRQQLFHKVRELWPHHANVVNDLALSTSNGKRQYRIVVFC